MDISVVIPLYNKEKYILRTITSVLNQTISPAEIIIVDDGSTDNSANEVEKINDSRVRLVRQENAGEGAARNRGVAESKRDLIAFLDADDEWKPDFLLYIQKLRNNFPDCGAYATSYEIVTWGNLTIHQIFEGFPHAPWLGILPNFFKMSQNGSPLSSSSVAIPKTVFEDLSGFPEGIMQGADRMLWVRLGIKYPIAFSPSSQVIVHGDAINRASSSFVSEPATANLIDKMLENQEVPMALLEDVKDYNAYLKIEKAKHRIKAGESKLAKDLLKSIRKNRKYRGRILWWYFWSLIPYPVIKKLTKEKYSS